MKKVTKSATVLAGSFVLAAVLSACSPEVGSKEWCEDIKKKGVENVTAKEAAEFAKSCVL